MLLYGFILMSSAFMAQYAQNQKSNVARRKINPEWILVFCFFFLFFFSAIRYGVAIDYASYEEIFEKIRKGYIVHTEIGFNFIVKYVSLFTKDNRLLFAIFAFLTMFPTYKVIQKRSTDWGLSVFLFVALGYYFFSYQTIRQYLAYMIALYALDKMIDKKYFLFIIWSVIGTMFHKSCGIILPVYLISQIRLNKVLKLLLFLSGFVVVRYREILRNIIFFIYPSYRGSVYDKVNISYKNLLICMGFYVVVLLCCYGKKKGRELNILGNLCFYCIYFYLFCWWIPEISRIGFFLLIPVAVLLPNILSAYRNTRHRALLKACIYFGGTAVFCAIMSVAGDITLRLLPYRTWIRLG